MKQRIIAACATISPQVLRSVCTCFWNWTIAVLH